MLYVCVCVSVCLSVCLSVKEKFILIKFIEASVFNKNIGFCDFVEFLV